MVLNCRPAASGAGLGRAGAPRWRSDLQRRIRSALKIGGAVTALFVLAFCADAPSDSGVTVERPVSASAAGTGDPRLGRASVLAASLEARPSGRRLADARTPGASVAPRAGAPSWVEREAWLMGTRLRARVAASERGAAIAAAERAFGAVRRLEALLSTWRDDTELARLNAAPPGVPVRVDRELFGLLREAARLSERTAGAFDPAVGPLIEAWGMRGDGRRPTGAELRAALLATGLRLFTLDAASGTVTKARAGAWIDSGGFGKGAGLRAAAEALRRAGVEAALLDFGGQVLVLGRSERPEWKVAVAHPARRHEPVALLRLHHGSVATTGAAQRFVQVGGVRLGHVLDPRTGQPVPAWGSVTVLADDPVVADALATALFVLGPEKGRAWASRARDVGVLLLEDAAGDLIAAWNPAMEAFLVQAPEALRR